MKAPPSSGVGDGAFTGTFTGGGRSCWDRAAKILSSISRKVSPLADSHEYLTGTGHRMF